MAITLRSGDTQSGEIAKENKVCMSGKVGISGKSGMLARRQVGALQRMLSPVLLFEQKANLSQLLLLVRKQRRFSGRTELVLE